MIATFFYKVADNVWSITIDHNVWERVNAPYLPFEYSPTPNEDIIFNLSVTDETANFNYKALESLGNMGSDEDVLWVYRDSNQYLLHIQCPLYFKEQAILHTISKFTKGILYITSNIDMAIYSINNALMFLYAMNGLKNNRLMFHASVVEKDDKAYLFLGRSGTGKSTHSQLWLKLFPDATLLNDDNPIVMVDANHYATVYGSPWSGKTKCYKNRGCKIGGIVRLQQAPHNTIKATSGVEAYTDIRPSISVMSWERELADMLHNTIIALIKCLPIARLECLPNEEAALLCYKHFQ